MNPIIYASIKFLYFLCLIYYCFGLFAYAQKVYLSKAKYNICEPIEIIIESKKSLTVDVNNFPKLEGLDFIGSSQSYQKLNHQNTYTYFFLFKAQRIGNILIPPFTLKLNQNTIDFKGKTIYVYSEVPFYQNNISPIIQNEIWKLNPNDVILEIQFNKNQAFVGEQIQQKVFLYIKEDLVDKIFFEPVSVQNFLQNIKNSHFWEENIDSLPFQNVSFESKNGIRYQKFLLNYSILFAFYPGSVHYESVPLKIKKKKFLNKDNLDNPLEEVTIYSNSLDLTITETNHPGLLTGTFFIEIPPIPKIISIGEKLDFNFTIKGNGNLNTLKVELPKLNKPCDIFEHTPQIKHFVSQNDFMNSIRFEYQIVPNDTGIYTIAPLKIPYFNTQVRKKEFLIIPKITFMVEKKSDTLSKTPKKQNFEIKKYSYTGWNIQGLIFLFFLLFVILWLIIKS